ncbi:MAG TPA: phosphate ABC transporter ATP-binding protein [Cyanobacteria bacterium UBA8156]|jgi:phosphate transport system ATP-binding protein|nr:phosphate ABC transporter ATP-binding protein [Cyanobacteria bacterium UBA8156]
MYGQETTTIRRYVDPNIRDATPALRAQDVAFSYGTTKVLEGVSMDMYPNQITALIGPSGCGKSTFLKALNRIGELETKVKVDGKIEFFGQDIYAPGVNLNTVRRQICMVFQRPNPFPISIYDNIAYGLRLVGMKSKAKLDEVVETALKGAAIWDEVKDKLQKSALGLSGGQQQRLCIARVIAVQPKIILMDEPCSALDPISTIKIEELMLELKEKFTIVIVTHNMQQASRVSDYTAFFNAGEDRMGHMVEYDHTVNIFGSASNQATRDYVNGKFG